MKKLLFIFASLLLASACSKDDSHDDGTNANDPNNPAEKCYPVKIVSTTIGEDGNAISSTATYEYDSKNRVVKRIVNDSKGNTYDEYFYTNDLLAENVSGNVVDGVLKPSKRCDFEYKDGKPSVLRFSSIGSDGRIALQNTENLFYENGLLSRIEWKDGKDGISIAAPRYNGDGNLIGCKEGKEGAYSIEASITYDDKPSHKWCVPNVYGVEALYTTKCPLNYEKLWKKADGSATINSVFTYTYEYSKSGYPIKIVEKIARKSDSIIAITSGGDSGIVTGTTTSSTSTLSTTEYVITYR